MEKRRQRAYEELNQLSSNFKGSIKEERGSYSLQIDKNVGTGDIKCTNFDDGLFMLEFDVNLREDAYLSLSSEHDQSIYFLYCFQGDTFYAAQRNNHFVQLNELQTAIAKTNNNFAGGLVFKENSNIKLNLLRIDTETYFEKHATNPSYIAQNLKDFFTEINQQHSLVHIGQLNLEIADYVKKLSKAKYADNLSELLYFEGICVLILASHIEQYRSETSGKFNSTKLIKREIQSIMSLADRIVEQPEQQYTVQLLSNDSGLSAAKLQEGFKFLYQRTVADFIRNARLEKAEKLIRETDMNVSEVVYSVGLTSRSYFCKIFKQKFKCNPKSYKSKLNIGFVNQED